MKLSFSFLMRKKVFDVYGNIYFVFDSFLISVKTNININNNNNDINFTT